MTILKSSIDIVAMAEEVRVWVEEKGWNDDRTFGDECILIVSEVVEALEAYRDRGYEAWITYSAILPDGTKLPKMTSEQLQALGVPSELWGQPRREGVAPELAGTLVRLLDTCVRHRIDLGEEFRKEMDYNWTRAYRHGGKAI